VIFSLDFESILPGFHGIKTQKMQHFVGEKISLICPLKEKNSANNYRSTVVINISWTKDDHEILNSSGKSKIYFLILLK